MENWSNLVWGKLITKHRPVENLAMKDSLVLDVGRRLGGWRVGGGGSIIGLVI